MVKGSSAEFAAERGFFIRPGPAQREHRSHDPPVEGGPLPLKWPFRKRSQKRGCPVAIAPGGLSKPWTITPEPGVLRAVSAEDTVAGALYGIPSTGAARSAYSNSLKLS